MLTENDVIDFLVKYLKKREYEIISICNTGQRGNDIVAKKEDRFLIVEAKGQTSSDPNSKRYGIEFDTAQKKIHVAEAILKTMEIQDKYPNGTVAIALPDDNRHRNIIRDIKPSLKKLDIIIFFIDKKGNVAKL